MRISRILVKEGAENGFWVSFTLSWCSQLFFTEDHGADRAVFPECCIDIPINWGVPRGSGDIAYRQVNLPLASYSCGINGENNQF